MTIDSTFRLEQLSLHNFRCFMECTIDLHPELTVLVSENGGGKTALLDGMKIALGSFIDFVSDEQQEVDLVASDIRRVHEKNNEMQMASQSSYTATAHIGGQAINWSRFRKRSGARSHSLSKGMRGLYDVAQNFREQIDKKLENTVNLPLVAFYGTDRFRREVEGTKKRQVYPQNNRMAGYGDCLSSSSSLKQLVNWYEMRMVRTADPAYSHTGMLGSLLPLLSSVEKSMLIVLEPVGWQAITWVSTEEILLAEHSDQSRLPPSMLSDGVRTMLALVMDIARRCFILNPQLGEEAAQQTPGVILIDEVDMHLHPGWQQQIVDLLRNAFPKMQLILSTHSPQILSTVTKESIRIIRLNDGYGMLETPKYQTRGVESADILARIMGVDTIPKVAEAQWVSDYLALIQKHLLNTKEAHDLRQRLENHFGSEHPVVLECDRIIRLEQFKQTLNHK